MARPISIRASYRDDAAHQLRLEAAVAKDTRQPRNWVVRQTRILRRSALGFLEADGRSNQREVERVAGVGKSRRSRVGAAT